MRILVTIFKWIITISIIVLAFIYAKKISFPQLSLSSFEIIFTALSIAFTWVEILKWGVTKPFNCLKCMTGWAALIIGCLCIGWHGIIYLPIGLFIGSIFSAIQMRYL